MNKQHNIEKLCAIIQLTDRKLLCKFTKMMLIFLPVNTKLGNLKLPRRELSFSVQLEEKLEALIEILKRNIFFHELVAIAKIFLLK